MSEQRLSVRDIDQEAVNAVLGMSRYVRAGTLEPGLLALVESRASQINGCAWCLDMHTEEARRAGVQQRRLDLLAAWHEAGDLFSEREQAALEFTEAVTLISEEGVPDAVWSRVQSSFDEKETLRLLMAIATINVWNRLNVTIRQPLPETPAIPA